MTRADARNQIVDAANKRRFNKDSRPPYTMRHLEQCVCLVRRRTNLSNDVLVVAGFNPRKAA